MATQFCTQCGAKLAPKSRFCTACGAEAAQSAAKPRQKPRPRKKQRRTSRGSSSMALWALVGGIVLLLVAGALALSNRSRPAPAVSEIPDYHNEEGIPYPEVPRISVTEAKALYDAGTALIVDVRSQGEYDSAHVANALSLPLADMEARYQELPKDARIITYCT